MTVSTEPTEIDEPQLALPGRFEAYPTEPQNMGLATHPSSDIDSDSLERLSEIVHSPEIWYSKSIREVYFHEANELLGSLPTPHGGIIVYRGKKHELIINDDPNLVGAVEAIKSANHEDKKRSLGAKALTNAKKAFRRANPEGEIIFAIDQFTKIRDEVLRTDSSEFTVTIPHVSINFAESFPGAELTPEEIYVLLETDVGYRRKQPSGEEGVEVRFALAMENILNKSGEDALQLWHTLKPYFKEFPSLIAEINKAGALAHGDILGINKFTDRYGKETSAFQARMALRALAINIAQTAFDFNMANTKDLR